MKPQRGEEVSKTSDAADQVNASVGRTEMLPTVPSRWSSQLVGAWGQTANNLLMAALVYNNSPMATLHTPEV